MDSYYLGGDNWSEGDLDFFRYVGVCFCYVVLMGLLGFILCGLG